MEDVRYKGYRMLCDGAGAGDGTGPGDIYGLSMETVGISPGEEPGEPGQAPGEVSTDLGPPGGETTTLTGESGGGIKELKAEEKKPVEPTASEVIKEKEKEKEVKGIPKAKKRQRRPTILTDEQGLMYTSPGKRRSLLGG